MSLIKQLWLAIAVTMLLAFMGSLAISLGSARHHLQEQLYIANVDNAQSLAQSLSQAEKDPALLQTWLAARFDTGHYQQIRLRPVQAEPIELLATHSHSRQVPVWFQRWFELHAPAGIAQVSDNWLNYGEVEVQSQTSYAMASLWAITKRLCIGLLLITLVCGFIASILLKRIIRPLDAVIQQAEAIGERRFLLSKEPRTLEFSRLVAAMNRLSARVRSMLAEESKQLEAMRLKAMHDDLTSLLNRTYFNSQLDRVLQQQDEESRHLLTLVRVPNLTELNQQLGRHRTDQLLAQLAEQLQNWNFQQNPSGESYTGRLNSSDFALLLTHCDDPEKLHQSLTEKMHRLCEDLRVFWLPVAMAEFDSAQPRAQLMMHMDNLLARAEAQQNRLVVFKSGQPETLPFQNAIQWRQHLTAAIEAGELQFITVAMNDKQGNAVHRELDAQLLIAGQWRKQSFYLPWLHRLGMLPEFDLALVKLAVQQLREQCLEAPVAISLSIETVANADTYFQLLELLAASPQQARQVTLQIPAGILHQHHHSLLHFIQQARECGCGFGIEQGSSTLESISLTDLGLDYLKLNPVFSQKILSDAETRQYLQRLTTLMHSLGINVYLQEVQTTEQFNKGLELGLDGGSGL